MTKDEAYYKCPHCKGKVRLVLDENGRLRLLKHEEAGSGNPGNL